MADDSYAAVNLKALRTAANMSRQSLIDEIKEKNGLTIHSTSLRRIEEGEQPMKANEAMHFANFFEVPLDAFIEAPIGHSYTEIQADLKTYYSRRYSLRLELEAWAAWHEVCKEKYREDYVAESDDSEELQAITRSSHRSFRALLKHDSASVEDARKLESKLGDSWDFEEMTGGDGTR